MKVVHIATIDVGGAYKAAKRICEAMQEAGVESRLLLRSKTDKESLGEPFFSSNINGIIRRLILALKNGINKVFSPKGIDSDLFGTDISKDNRILEADVIYIHWVNSFLTVRNVRKLLKIGKPVVWVMHDMWLMTGGCHYDHYCEGYKTGCKNCLLVKNGIAEKNYNRKKRFLNDFDNLIIVGISQWMSDVARSSSITRQKKIVTVFNPINDDVFVPKNDVEISHIKRKYNIPVNKRVILCGAMETTGNATKGYAYLRDAINKLHGDDYIIVMFGNCAPKEQLGIDLPVIVCGLIKDEQEMNYLYAMADVFVTASIEEGFGYTVCESLASGTPVAAFDVGGISEQIIHKRNGYLAKRGDSNALSRGIKFICDEFEKDKSASLNIIKNDYDTIGREYMNIATGGRWNGI